MFNIFFIVGLKKFLAQYPALFQIEGDYVQVSVYQAAQSADASGNDYIDETIEYFKNKLLQYGIGTEVPIKSLLGHRSQASPQVRHISGQHIKEFTEFLQKHPETFQVVDDHVILVDLEGVQDVPQSERLHLPQPSIDTKATQELLDYIAETIEIQGPQIVFSLFHAVTSKFPQEQWFRMFKTPNDLSTFLKLFSDCFHIQSDLVALLQKPKLSDQHIQNAQAKFITTVSGNSTNNNINTKRSSTNNRALQRAISPQYENNNGLNIGKSDTNNDNVGKVGDFKLNEPVSVNHMSHNTQLIANRSEPNSGFDSLITEIKLENLCPNNCPIIIAGRPTPPQSPIHPHLGKLNIKIKFFFGFSLHRPTGPLLALS